MSDTLAGEKKAINLSGLLADADYARSYCVCAYQVLLEMRITYTRVGGSTQNSQRDTNVKDFGTDPAKGSFEHIPQRFVAAELCKNLLANADVATASADRLFYQLDAVDIVNIGDFDHRATLGVTVAIAAHWTGHPRLAMRRRELRERTFFELTPNGRENTGTRREPVGKLGHWRVDG